MTSRMKQSNLTSLSTVKLRSQQKSLQEQVYEMPIENIEAQRLHRTFLRMCGERSTQTNFGKTQKEEQKALKDKFDKKDVIRVLTELAFPYSKPQVDQWIWEVDEDLDGCINQYEFTLMYKRCIFDKTGLEPRNLFNLVQFLMFDLACRNRITVEDTLELIYVRNPEQTQLQKNIDLIFNNREKTEDGQEREIFFQQYLKQMRANDLQKRKMLEKQRKTVTGITIKKKEQ